MTVLKPSMTHAVSLNHMQHILSCSTYTDIRDDTPSFIQSDQLRATNPIPWQEPQVPTNPYWYFRDQMPQSNDLSSMKSQHLLSNGKMILIKNELSSKTVAVSKDITEASGKRSPLMKRFEEDVHMISMISQSSTLDNCNRVTDRIYSTNADTTTDMDERVIEFSSSLSSYPSPVSTFCSSSVLDIADYSLLDDGDGDDYDLLTYFGIKSSRWTIQDRAASSSEDDWIIGEDDN